MSEININREEIREFIYYNPLFSSLSPDVIEDIADRFQPVYYKQGQILFREGDSANSFYILCSGRLNGIKYTPDGKELILFTLEPGDAFGEKALLSKVKRTTTIKADEDSMVLRLSRKDFSLSIQKYPNLLEKVNALSRRVSLFPEEETAEEITEEFKATYDFQVDLPLLDFLIKLNIAAGGVEQVEHCRETALLAMELSKVLCPRVSEEMAFAAYLHEIGKISISDAIVKKERRGKQLSLEEKEKFSRIYDYALEILSPVKYIREKMDFIKFLNCECYKDMPLRTQILKVADDYQELVNINYSNMPREEAIKTIKKYSGTKYNPKIVNALENILEKFHSKGSATQLLFIKCMNIALNIKDQYTEDHSENVATISLKLADKLNLPREQRLSLNWAGRLHDVGKIWVSEEILNAPRKLESWEFEIIKRHPEDGAELFKQIPGMEDVVLAVKHHHEKFDGTGYPDGLKEKDIPLLARILTVADVYSALTTRRVYRLDEKGQRIALTKEQALDLMENKMKGHFDPQILSALKEIISEEKVSVKK